jgi:hypothetical protein
VSIILRCVTHFHIHVHCFKQLTWQYQVLVSDL